MLSSSYSNFSNAQAASQLRQPRGIVLINDIPVIWQYIEVTTTTFYLADSYRVTIPISGQPFPIDLNYLATTAPITIKIYMGFPVNPLAFTTTDLDLKMVGDVDKLEIDPLTQTAVFSGRDLTSRLIDMKTYNKYPNQSSASIATLLANEHQLMPIVTSNAASSQIVGTFYTLENTLMTKETTEWDLLCFLAQQINFVCYVQNQNLIFKPRPQPNTPEAGIPFILQYITPNIGNASPQFSGMDLKISRSLTLAKDVVVKIRVPYSPQTGKAFTTVVSAPRVKPTSPSVQTYVYTFPGLSRNQALLRGKQILNDITIHELRLDARVPGNTLLQKDSLIQLQGTNTSLDQFYFADQVDHTMSIDEGYMMSISAKNHSVDSQVPL